jgi:hypothetical protein
MFSEALLEVLKEVLTSWQVIAVTLALILFFRVVNYVAKAYHRPKASKKKSGKKSKKAEAAAAPAAAPAAEHEEAGSGASSNEELGLEES